MARDESVRVDVVISHAPRQVTSLSLVVARGKKVRDALRASALAPAHQELPEGVSAVGVWGRIVALDALLNDGDRVELYRVLQVDPKEARRLRYRAQGERGRTPRPRKG
jgi:uncharacterized protein